MDIHCFKENDVSVVEPDGRIDTTSAHELEEAVNGELKGGSRLFLIDFAAVEYISSAGLRILLMLAKKLTGAEERMALCSMNQSVAEVFDIAGFGSVFDIFSDRPDAMRRLTVSSATVDRVKRAVALLKAKPRGTQVPHLSEAAIVGYELLTRKSIRPAAAPEAEPAVAGPGATEEPGAEAPSPLNKAAGWLKRLGKN